jgi:antitoxin VapB
MATARLFKSGNSQAVRLPKEFRFEGEEVEIVRRGNDVILRPKPSGLGRAFEILSNLPIDTDAIERLRKEPPQSRDDL